MNIAICDDEKHERQLLEGWLREDETLQAVISEYASTASLIKDVERGLV